jgi:hypothetical protein
LKYLVISPLGVLAVCKCPFLNKSCINGREMMMIAVGVNQFRIGRAQYGRQMADGSGQAVAMLLLPVRSPKVHHVYK